MSSPLFDTLFRSTTVSTATPAAPASAPPVRVRGTRTRAGNAMDRTRAALLASAAGAVAAAGTRVGMAQVAAAAGVAKATLYNHFRTREAVLGALVVDQVRQLVDDQDGVVLRWLSSFVLSPSSARDIAADAALLVAALPGGSAGG